MDKELEEKLNVIRDAVQSAFPDAEIELVKGMSLSKLKIDRKGLPPCCLAFAWECLLNQNEDKILDELENVFSGLSNASEPMKILVTESRGKICLTRQI
jgi:hypothetical protein